MMMWRYLFRRKMKGKMYTPDLEREVEAIFKDFNKMTPDELMRRIEEMEDLHGITKKDKN
jgi:hypothetical protein